MGCWVCDKRFKFSLENLLWCLVADFGEPGHSERLQSRGAAKRAQAQGPSEQDPAWTLPALEKRVKNLEDKIPVLIPLKKIIF